jgi:hypothetical protein
MALVWSSTSDELSRIRFVSEIPDGFEDRAALQGGRLALRTGAGAPHLLWVSEAAHTGDVAGSWDQAGRAVTLPALALQLRDRIPGLYVDALDMQRSGQVAVTLGLAAG